MANESKENGTMEKSDRSVKHSLNVSSGYFEVYLEKCTSYVVINVLIPSHAPVPWSVNSNYTENVFYW